MQDKLSCLGNIYNKEGHKGDCDSCEVYVTCCKKANKRWGDCNCEFKERCFYERQNHQKEIRDRLGLDITDCKFYIMFTSFRKNLRK